MTIKTEPKLLRRTTAAIIDYGLYFIFYFWLVFTFGVPDDEGGNSLNNDPKVLWIPVVWLVYFPIIESIKGQTLGKLILGLRVVSKSGNPISFVQAFKRHLVDIIDSTFFGVVAYVTIRNTPDHQRVGDLWAKTIVVGGDDFRCSSCGISSTLTLDELKKREFVCPSCKTVNGI